MAAFRLDGLDQRCARLIVRLMGDCQRSGGPCPWALFAHDEVKPATGMSWVQAKISCRGTMSPRLYAPDADGCFRVTHDTTRWLSHRLMAFFGHRICTLWGSNGVDVPRLEAQLVDSRVSFFGPGQEVTNISTLRSVGNTIQARSGVIKGVRVPA